MFLNEEEQCSRLRAAADKKDMTLIDYEELYNKRAELDEENDKESKRQEEIRYRDVIRGILGSICYYMSKFDTIMKYELPDNVPVWIIVDIFQRHGYSVRDTVENDKKILVFYLDEPKRR